MVETTPSDRAEAIRFSLRTADPAEAKARQAEALAFVETMFTSLRKNQPVELTQRQCVALSKYLYESWAEGEGKERTIAVEVTADGVRRVEPEPDELSEGFLAGIGVLQLADQQGRLEEKLGPIVDRLLRRVHIFDVGPHTRTLLLTEFMRALKDAFELRARNAQGDYSPDHQARRFPPWEAPSSDVGRAPARPDVSLTRLVQDWWGEAEKSGTSPKTFESYRNTMRKFTEYLGHDDATRVTRNDVIGFKDHRLNTPSSRTGKPVSPRTIKDADLAGLKSVFNWAVANNRLSHNPADGVTIKLAKPVRTRDKGFTPGEAKGILGMCQRLERGSERAETFAAKRWVPWLQAYTGARIGEIAQLRKEDLIKEDGHLCIKITPDAGTVKGNRMRVVPLHPHLLELGFPSFVSEAPSGHLFMRVPKGGSVLGQLKGVENRVREFVREIVPDPNVQPSHAWRHLFITLCRKHGVDQELRRMITGHSGKGVDESVYGDPAGLFEAICKLPRFDV